MGSDETRIVSAILQHTPNGVVLVDDRSRVQFVNPSFRRMFQTGDGSLIGRPAGELLHSDCFERAISSGGEASVRGSIPEHGIFYRVGIFRIEDENRYCGIFVDTSEEERARRELSEVKRQTLERAREVIGRQMRTAQEIAGLLGETTAETKTLLAKLAALFREEEKPAVGG